MSIDVEWGAISGSAPKYMLDLGIGNRFHYKM